MEAEERIARELGLDRGTVGKYLASNSKSATNPQTGSVTVPGLASLCDPWREQIEADLVLERQFSGKLCFGAPLCVAPGGCAGTAELPFRRMECSPGQELQVDFGQGAWVMENGKRRRPHLFRAVLSYSRKAYSEVGWRQTSESFLLCLENARYFGGVTTTVVPDKLKAGERQWGRPLGRRVNK